MLKPQEGARKVSPKIEIKRGFCGQERGVGATIPNLRDEYKNTDPLCRNKKYTASL